MTWNKRELKWRICLIMTRIYSNEVLLIPPYKCIIASANPGWTSKVCGSNEKLYLSSVTLWQKLELQHRFLKGGSSPSNTFFKQLKQLLYCLGLDFEKSSIFLNISKHITLEKLKFEIGNFIIFCNICKIELCLLRPS